MAKHKTVTVNVLHKLLGKLIDAGDGRRQVCIDKTTFRDNREDDGVVILAVDGVRLEHVQPAGDDGGVRENKDGSEAAPRRTAVLYGESGTSYTRVVSEDSVERFIRELPWTAEATDHEKTIAAGNIRNFAQHIRMLTGN